MHFSVFQVCCRHLTWPDNLLVGLILKKEETEATATVFIEPNDFEITHEVSSDKAFED